MSGQTQLPAEGFGHQTLRRHLEIQNCRQQDNTRLGASARLRANTVRRHEVRVRIVSFCVSACEVLGVWYLSGEEGLYLGQQAAEGGATSAGELAGEGPV